MVINYHYILYRHCCEMSIYNEKILSYAHNYGTFNIQNAFRDEYLSEIIKSGKGVGSMKISIVYVSETGYTEKAAGLIKEGILSAGAFDVKLMNLIGDQGLDPDFLKESDAVIIGTPTYAANMAWQLKKWF